MRRLKKPDTVIGGDCTISRFREGNPGSIPALMILRINFLNEMQVPQGIL